MADSYVSVGQNTAYFYKLNVVQNDRHSLYSHQYMTNIQDPSSQARNLYNKYVENGILDASLNFIIPVYKNMPGRCDLPTSMDTSASNVYLVKATNVVFRSGMGLNSTKIGSFSNEYVTVLNMNAGNVDGINWAHVRSADGREGYITSQYLVKV